MPERTAELTPQDALTYESAVVYRTEREAHEDAADTLYRTNEDVELSQKARDAAVQESNDFGKANMDALHEAAILEAAQRVANVYETSEPTQENPDPGGAD